ncbi:MAG: hypothetical protein HYZ84_02645 [Candidatus Omnitrophica bacterium]|nr:hypothetical protein [Candidatus Omnitrophota bacterium]
MPESKTYLFIFLLIIVIGPVFSSVLAYQKLQKNMKIHIDGNFIPFPLFPGFQVREAYFTWRDKVELISGNLNVRYNLVFFLPSSFRIRVQGRSLQVKLLGSWAAQEGIQNLNLDFFEADLGLDRSGIREIYGIEAISPQFQFRVKKSETLKSKRESAKELAA